MNPTPKKIDICLKEFYGELQKRASRRDSSARDEIKSRYRLYLGEKTSILIRGATLCFEYEFTSESGSVIVEYTEDCRICRPDCLDELAEFCDLLKAIGGYRHFRFRGSDGHWYMRWNPGLNQWVKGALIDG